MTLSSQSVCGIHPTEDDPCSQGSGLLSGEGLKRSLMELEWKPPGELTRCVSVYFSVAVIKRFGKGLKGWV